VLDLGMNSAIAKVCKDEALLVASVAKMKDLPPHFKSACCFSYCLVWQVAK